ncbi:MAG: carboxynorspermidine decarboxylase [Bacteroidales bacterium]|jgi:carboxynorspermidine decarboxylase|nr:carboxynorspermidine decarboxylase [Bacteroidales bacterium]
MIDFSQIPSPCYVIDEDLLRGNLQIIRSVSEQSGVDIIPALKGFALWGVFPVMRPFVKGVSASSANEARLACEEMKAPAHSYSPAYTDADFDEILTCSSHITFNSLTQYSRCREKVHRCAYPVSMGLRVNPEITQVETALYNPCAPGSRLGMTQAQLGNTLPADIEGLHIHALCESSADATAQLIQAVETKFGAFFPHIKWINFGGGHLMTRKDYDIALLVKTLLDFRARYPHIRVILEPGAAFAWDTGVLRTTIEDIVVNGGIRTAILDASFTAHMPDCLEMPYKPRIRGASEPQHDKQHWRIGGNSCLAGDYMGEWSFDEEPYIGKTIVFEDMIHYTMVKTTTFNGVPHPSIGVYSQNNGFTLLKSFGYEDYKTRLS